MKILSVEQGSAGWLAARAKHFCASEAPAVMGASKYCTRSELLRQKATGITEEVDPDTQRRFDAGHAAEAATRPLVEALLNEELFPVVATDDDDWLLASFDGITIDGSTGFECKLWNDRVVAQIRSGELDPMYFWQLEQQILVGGLERVIFACSDGTPEKFVHMEYRAVPGRADQLLGAWAQFERDLAEYKPVEVIPAVVATPTLALPAVSIQVSGAVALTSNLGPFLTELQGFIAKLPEKPSTDQEFADCKAACKTLQEAQYALDAAEASALGQVASFDEMKRAKALCFDLARNTRLALEKLVVAREKSIKEEIVMGGTVAFAEHVASLNKRLGKNYMPTIQANFATVIKGQKTIASLRNKVDTELARVKIEANEVADRIQINLNTLRELASEHTFLFSDAAQIVQKQNDDLAILVKSRIAEHKAAKAKEEEETRERIRKEEETKAEAKVKAEAEAKIKAEQEATPKAAVQASQMPDTGTTGNERPSSHFTTTEPLPVTAATKPAVKLTSTGIRPTDVNMIKSLAQYYQVSPERVINWLRTADLTEAEHYFANQVAA